MTSPKPIRINLALQGGGAHGAFTWGVLDRLLEDEGIEIAAISGTSAGALNGAALKSGLLRGGPKGARASLDQLWAEVAELSDFHLAAWMQPFMPGLQAVAQIAQSFNPLSASGIAAQLISPYAWGPAWSNPLAPIVARLDFSHLHHAEGPRLFVGATCVETGRGRIFTGQNVTPDALLASACLPSVFQAVQIEGRHYWDGGYSGNPALFPLYEPAFPDDILLVAINPFTREGLPMTPMDISDRATEIGFNTALTSELRAIHFVRRLIAKGQMERGQMKDVHMHLIADEALMTALPSGSKTSPSPALFARLKAAGRAAADTFLTHHRADLGHRPSFDLRALFG